MKKSTIGGLVMLAVGAVASADGLYEKVKDYLNEVGLPKEEYFMNHAIFLFSDGEFKYRRSYLVGGKPLLAEFMPYNPQQISQTAAVANLDNGADIYFFDNFWYEDPECDGINGNETELQNVESN